MDELLELADELLEQGLYFEVLEHKLYVSDLTQSFIIHIFSSLRFWSSWIAQISFHLFLLVGVVFGKRYRTYLLEQLLIEWC